MVRKALEIGIEKLINTLKNTPVECLRIDAGVILCHVLNCDKTYLYTNPFSEIDKNLLKDYFAKIDLRSKGMPVQYIIGHQEFMSLDFKVTPDVLIPRCDTEILVEAVIENFKRNGSIVKIMDMCAGSGCIAVSLAHYIKGSTVLAIDNSKKALEIAELNAQRNNVNDKIKFHLSNLFEDCNEIEKNSFDVIVSNPPYITKEEMMQLQKEVKDYEPESALYGGADGLYFYRKIIKRAPDFLKPAGAIAFEVGFKQAGDVSMLMEGIFKNIQIIKDLSGIDRVVIGYKA